MTKNVGAPESKIKITPEMIEAGADVIWTFFYDAVARGSETGRAAASAVYRAMNSQKTLSHKCMGAGQAAYRRSAICRHSSESSNQRSLSAGSRVCSA
jgi:hypothetical protein